jgi:hypothetical protein
LGVARRAGDVFQAGGRGILPFFPPGPYRRRCGRGNGGNVRCIRSLIPRRADCTAFPYVCA